jgi:hypothetical protein
MSMATPCLTQRPERDAIVCWKHNWPDCPEWLNVIELSKIAKGLEETRGVMASGGTLLKCCRDQSRLFLATDPGFLEGCCLEGSCFSVAPLL